MEVKEDKVQEESLYK